MSDDEEAMQNAAVMVTVMVVDDEPAICKAMKMALERGGYHVVTALSGDSALAQLAAQHVDVMLIDLRIPDTRGDVVFELAAATQPHLRKQTLFMTGDINEKAMKLIASCRCPMLEKPFTLTEMLAAVGSLAPREARGAQGRAG